MKPLDVKYIEALVCDAVMKAEPELAETIMSAKLHDVEKSFVIESVTRNINGKESELARWFVLILVDRIWRHESNVK